MFSYFIILFIFIILINYTYSKEYNQCPGTFVIVYDDVTYNSEVIRVNGTNCAYNYRNPIYTPKEYNIFDKVTLITSTLGSISILLLVFVWIKSKHRVKKFLIISFASVSAIPSIILCITSFIPPDKRLSNSPSEPINYSNGISFCAVQSFILQYGSLATAFCWLVVAMSLFAKIVYRIKIHRMKYMIISNIIIIFLIPLIPTIYVFNNNQFGYGGNLPWCFIRRKAGRFYDLDIFYLPIFFTLTIGLLLKLPVIYTIIMTQLKSQSSAPTPIQSRKTILSLASKSSESSPYFASFINSISSTPASRYVKSNTAKVVPVSKADVDIQRINFTVTSPSLGSSSLPSSLPNSLPSSMSNTATNSQIISQQKAFTFNDTSSKQTNSNKTTRRMTLLASFSKNSNNQSNNLNKFQKMKEILKTLKTSLCFLLFYLLLWIPVFAYRYNLYYDYADILTSLHEWTDCVFENYNMISDDSYIHICGSHPKRRMSVGYNVLCILLLSGQSIFVVLTFVSINNVIIYINNYINLLYLYIYEFFYPDGMLDNFDDEEKSKYHSTNNKTIHLTTNDNSHNNVRQVPTGSFSYDLLDRATADLIIGSLDNHNHSNNYNQLDKQHDLAESPVEDSSQSPITLNNTIHEINLPGSKDKMFIPHKALTRLHSDKSIAQLLNNSSKSDIENHLDKLKSSKAIGNDLNDEYDDGLDIFTCKPKLQHKQSSHMAKLIKQQSKLNFKSIVDKTSDDLKTTQDMNSSSDSNHDIHSPSLNLSTILKMKSIISKAKNKKTNNFIKYKSNNNLSIKSIEELEAHKEEDVQNDISDNHMNYNDQSSATRKESNIQTTITNSNDKQVSIGLVQQFFKSSSNLLKISNTTSPQSPKRENKYKYRNSSSNSISNNNDYDIEQIPVDKVI